MADVLAYNIPHLEEPDEIANDKKTRLLQGLVIALVSVLLVLSVLYGIVIPMYAPVEVHFSGLGRLDSEALLKETGVPPDAVWIHFDTAGFAASLLGNTAIESVSVEKKFPNTILVKVRERSIVANTFVTRSGRTVPMQVDRNGVVFTERSAVSERRIPLVTGLEFDALSDGMRISMSMRPLLEQLALVAESSSESLEAISEIHVVPTTYGSFELVVYPVNSQVRVLMDRNFDTGSLEAMLLVLDVLGNMSADIEQLDLRYGSKAFTYRRLEDE